MKLLFLSHLAFFILFIGCARAPIKEAHQALRPYQGSLTVEDHEGRLELIQAVEENIEFLIREEEKKPKIFQFGALQVPRSDYIITLQGFLRDLQQSSLSMDGLVKKHFEIYEVYGKDRWGDVFITGYYDPVIPGSRTKTEKFSRPAYAVPDDMVFLDVKEYTEFLPRFKSLVEVASEKKSERPKIRGRLVELDEEQKCCRKIVPYYSREEIDSQKLLSGRKLELVWLDPVDAFFLQIQGSGTVELVEGGRMRIGYGSQNGHPYVAIGKFLLDEIPIEQMSLQSIQRYLRSIPVEESQEIMNKNPSYVFFNPLEGRSITYMGSQVVPGRTIATDTRFFPNKGSLAYLEFNKPKFSSEGELLPEEEWEPGHRVVVDQDTGGAIRGPHRLDLYWGEGPEAEKNAGVMRHSGSLYYLIPKEGP